MSYVSHLQGTGSKVQYPFEQLMNLDPLDNRPVEMMLDLAAIANDYPDGSWYQPSEASMWRFGPLMALNGLDEIDKAFIPPVSVGYTPELDYSDHPLALAHKFQLVVKDEGQVHQGFGSNPTGSFKDRGMAMVAGMAQRFGLKKLVVPTQGNAGDSLAYFANLCGFEAAIIMPDDTPSPIIDNVRQLSEQNPNISLRLIKGTIREAGALMKAEYIPQGYFNVATFQEPGWRIEGKKSLGLEMAEPKKGQTAWQVPDVVLYPTGGGTGILGMWKAFNELQTLGMIGSKRPKIIAVQSEATQPVVTAIEQGLADVPAIDPGQTIATGLNVAGGVGLFKVLQIIRESRGTAIAINEADIQATCQQVNQDKGWQITTEGAATLAAIPRLIEQGYIKAGDKVVACNTCTLAKYQRL